MTGKQTKISSSFFCKSQVVLTYCDTKYRVPREMNILEFCTEIHDERNSYPPSVSNIEVFHFVTAYRNSQQERIFFIVLLFKAEN
jgi:hypothetical protein